MKSQFTFIITTAVIVLIFLFCSVERSMGQEVRPQSVCQNGLCWQVAPVVPMRVVYGPPQQIYVPQVTYQQYQYQGTSLHQQYTPIRTRWFGRYIFRPVHQYVPVQQ